MFWFKKKSGNETEKQEVANPDASWSFLGADMHSHFIPGIDDGSPDIATSIDLIRNMVDMGYRTLITTPHIFVDFYPNTAESIHNGFEKLKKAVEEEQIPVSIKAGAEYLIDEVFSEKINDEELLTINKKEVLVELPMLGEPPMYKDVMFKMMTKGYRPIMAHPERYTYLHNDFEKFSDMKDRGCLLQLNILSLTGHYGAGVKKIAEELLSKGLYDYCGSDVHHINHIMALKAMLQTKTYNLLSNYPFLNKNLCF